MSALTRDGREWLPTFLEAVLAEACIGCGRCYKVCGRSVLEPVERETDAGEDDDEYGEEAASTVMRVADAGSCVGCGACGRVCARRAQTWA